MMRNYNFRALLLCMASSLTCQFAAAKESYKVVYEVYEDSCLSGDCKKAALISGEMNIEMKYENESFASGTNTANFELKDMKYKLIFSGNKSKENAKWIYRFFGSTLIENRKYRNSTFSESAMELPSYVKSSSLILSLPGGGATRKTKVRFTLP